MFKVFLISGLASIGGLVVLWGLWLESQGEKDRFFDITDFRSSKSKAHAGLKWVFWGVALETVLGFGIALFEGAETIKVEIAAIASNPRKRPISVMTADIFLWTWPPAVTNSFEAQLRAADPSLPKLLNYLLILPRAFIAGKDTALGSLRCTQFELRAIPTNIMGGGEMYSLTFNWPSGYGDDNDPQGSPISKRSLSIEELGEKIGSLELSVTGLPTNSIIKQGACSLTLNGSTKWQFVVPKRMDGSWVKFLIQTNAPIPE